ncbi:MAG: MAC/perforin domain-containing protein [Bermanella sp.]
MATLPGVDYLGCIYKVSDRYADATSVSITKQLFDIPADTTDTLKSLDVINAADETDENYTYPSVYFGIVISETEISEAKAYTSEELYTSDAVSLNVSGSYGAFSGEVSTNYSSECTESSEYWNVVIKAGVKNYSIQMMDLTKLCDYLTDDFQDAIESVTDDVSAAALVESYGTHFLYKAIFGGEWKYTQSVSKYTYGASSSAVTQVSANYLTYSASGSIGSSTDLSTSVDTSNAMFYAKGGLAADVYDGYDAWLENVPGNYAMVEFDDDSLQPISVLVQDTSIKALIESAIEAALPAASYTGTSLTQDGSGDSLSVTTVGTGAVTSVSKCELYVAGDNPYEVITGFGGRIKNGDFTRIAVKILNLSTGESHWTAVGDSTVYNEVNYELIGDVPDGHVLTGIGLTENDDNLSYMVLYSQLMDPSGSSGAKNFLDNTNLVATYYGGDGSKQPAYELEYKPAASDCMSIGILGVNCGSKSISDIYLLRRTLILEE